MDIITEKEPNVATAKEWVTGHHTSETYAAEWLRQQCPDHFDSVEAARAAIQADAPA